MSFFKSLRGANKVACCGNYKCVYMNILGNFVKKNNLCRVQITLVQQFTVNLLSINHFSTNPTKWSNTLKQFVGKLPTNCLSVFDHFVKLALKVLTMIRKTRLSLSNRGQCSKKCRHDST